MIDPGTTHSLGTLTPVQLKIDISLFSRPVIFHIHSSASMDQPTPDYIVLFYVFIEKNPHINAVQIIQESTVLLF